MKKLTMAVIISALGALMVATVASANGASPPQACWGQATAVFTSVGDMGEHASQQPTPRVGLRNLARTLAEAGIIPDDSMTSLGVFVANDLGLSIDACGG